MENCESMRTPIPPSMNWNKDGNDKPIDQKIFRGMVESLLYLTISRLDIIFNIFLCTCCHILKNSTLKLLKGLCLI